MGETLQRALKRSGTKCKKVAVAVAGSAVITKVITMPASLNDSEMETQIEMEADQYIPYPLEEINLDFQVLGPNRDNPDRVDVLLAASRSENVEAQDCSNRNCWSHRNHCRCRSLYHRKCINTCTSIRCIAAGC